MTHDFEGLALRLKGIREAMDVSVEEMAEDLGISVEQYASYEETGTDVPISVIYRMANKFKVDLNEILTGDNAYLNTYQIVRRGDGIVSDRLPGYHFQDLAWRFHKKIMQPLLVTLDPSDEPAALVTHRGQEFNLVLEGEMAFTFGDTTTILREGDAVYFNPEHPHGQKCAGDVKTRFLTVIAE